MNYDQTIQLVGESNSVTQPGVAFQQLGAVPGSLQEEGLPGLRNYDPEVSLEIASSREAGLAPRDDIDNELPEEVLAAAMEGNFGYETEALAAGGEEGAAIFAQTSLGVDVEDIITTGQNTLNNNPLYTRHFGSNGALPPINALRVPPPAIFAQTPTSSHAVGLSAVDPALPAPT